MTNLTHARAKKSLGQHFLFDRDLLRRIALAAGPVEGKTVIEVGPGPGGLTRALLDANVARLIAVELDDRFAEALQGWPEVAEGRLHVHHGDARTVNETDLVAQVGGTLPALIVANLPYNVATPLVVNWIKAGDWRGPLVLMFQKEVAQRICSTPDDNSYGRLAVLTHGAMDARIAISLPPGAFRPPPKVDSAVVVLTPLPADRAFADLDALEIVAAAAFNQRRKMLRSALRALATSAGTTSDSILTAADIDPTRRAETLAQDEFRRLATAWRQSFKPT